MFGNHIFLNLIADAVVEPSYVREVIRTLASRYSVRIVALGVQEVEFKVCPFFDWTMWALILLVYR